MPPARPQTALALVRCLRRLEVPGLLFPVCHMALNDQEQKRDPRMIWRCRFFGHKFTFLSNLENRYHSDFCYRCGFNRLAGTWGQGK